MKKRHRRNPKKRVSTRRMPPGLAKYWRARNRRTGRRARRRNAAGFVVASHKGSSHLFYNGAGKFESRKSAHVYHDQRDAEATAYLLREGYANALKGWELIVEAA